MLQCGKEFLKRVLNSGFNLDDIVPRYGSVKKTSFLGTVGINFFEAWSLFKKDFMDCCVIPVK